MKTTAADLMRVLLDLDKQWLTSRPSPWGAAAELVALLCEHAEPSLRRPDVMGDWRTVDLSGVRKPAPRDFHQPDLDEFMGRR